MKGETYPDRIAYWHKNMGPSDSCDRCYGRGWHPEILPGQEDEEIPDWREAYCDCPCGTLRRDLEAERPKAP